uniref:Uncharacterized protein n=1 Tax=Anguilla anguilla TaxID=7936 RepID=A0A0E9SNW5_ANGAN
MAPGIIIQVRRRERERERDEGITVTGLVNSTWGELSTVI